MTVSGIRAALAADPGLGAGNVLHKLIEHGAPLDGPGITFDTAVDDHPAGHALTLGELRDAVAARAAWFSEQGVGPRGLRAELRVRLGRDREPDVELVVAQGVVAHARMGVDDRRGAPRVLRVDLGGDEHRGITQRAGVEDRRDLADDALVEQPLHARHHLLLCQLCLGGDVLVGPRGDREGALHQVEQPAVEVVERDRRAVRATAQLRLVVARPGRLDAVSAGARVY